MNTQLWWHLARASGIVAWLFLTASVLWGIFLSTKLLQRWRRPAWLADLHRWLGALTVGFVVVHLLALVADSYATFDLLDLTVPFASSWNRGAVALGVGALWLLLAVEVSSLMMKRLGRRTWRRIHMGSYLVFWLTSLHAAFAGTDTTNPLYRVTAIVSILAVVFALVYRLLVGKSGPSSSGDPVTQLRGRRRAPSRGTTRPAAPTPRAPC